MGVLGLVEAMEVAMLFTVDLFMGETTMNSLTHSSLNMECMMTSITQTSVSTGLVMSMEILWASTRLLSLMVGFSMLSTLLMVTMVALSWRFLTREKQDILILFIILLVMVMVDMEVELEEALEKELVEELEEALGDMELLVKPSMLYAICLI